MNNRTSTRKQRAAIHIELAGIAEEAFVRVTRFLTFIHIFFFSVRESRWRLLQEDLNDRAIPPNTHRTKALWFTQHNVFMTNGKITERIRDRWYIRVEF